MRTNPGCILVLALPLLFVSCDPAAPAGQVDGTCDDLTRGQEAYYEATMKPYFETYCFLCHASDSTDRHEAPAHANYDTFEAAQFSNFVTWARSIDGTMPPMGKMPSTEELTTLLDWLNCTLAVQEQNAADDDDSAR
jgi:cytochrome c5